METSGQDKFPLMIEAYNLGALFDPELGGDRTALIDCRDWERPGEYSHRQINDQANACARGLLARSLVRGDSVAILSANRAEYLIAYFGILRAGLVAVPINHKLPAETIAFILDHGEARVLLTDREFSSVITEALTRVKIKPVVIDIDDALAEGGALIGEKDYEAIL